MDDFYVVANTKEELRRIIPLMSKYLSENLGLQLSKRKTAIFSAYRGVEFLGAYLKPFRKYVGNGCLKRMHRKMAGVKELSAKKKWSAINSYLGMTSHFSAYNIRRGWIETSFRETLSEGYYSKGILTYVLKNRYTE